MTDAEGRVSFFCEKCHQILYLRLEAEHHCHICQSAVSLHNVAFTGTQTYDEYVKAHA